MYEDPDSLKIFFLENMCIGKLKAFHLFLEYLLHKMLKEQSWKILKTVTRPTFQNVLLM